MQQATQPQLSPNGQSLYQPQSDPNLQDKARTLRPKPQHEPLGSKESLPQDLDKDKKATHHIPRLRAVVESQAFKNILVDEMDMMLSRAATLIQANWRGYRLRQKLISQMTAAKAIQEAWRHFNTKRLLRSGKSVEKKVSVEEGDIPYHPPQQVRFQHPGESKSPLAQPIMVSKETQFPSSDSLAACTHQLVLLQTQSTPQPGIRVPCTIGGPNVTFLPHQTVAIRLPCPVSLDAKCRPCLLTRTVRNSCLVHVEGDTVKTKQGTARASKSGASGPPPPVRSAPAVHGSLKTQTQDHMEAEVFKAPPQTGPAPVITKTPPQPCVVPTGTVAKAPPQMYPAARMTKTPTPMYPAAAMTKTPLQSCLAAMMNKTPPQPCSTPTATITKTPPQMYQVGPVAKASPQTCPVAAVAKTSPQTFQPATVTKTPLQSCLAAMVNKTPPQPSPAAPVSKTPSQMRATASITNPSPQTRPAAMMAKISPQICLLASMIKPPTQTRPVAAMTKTPPQTCPVPAVAKTPPQTRLAAMVTKTPAQFRSVAAIIRTLCLPPPTAGNLKSSPPAAAAAGVPNTSSPTYLNGPKAKAVVDAKQTTGMVKISSHSSLPEGKVKYFPPPHLGAGTPKAPARPPLEAEKLKTFSQKQVKTETVSNTSLAVETPRASPWAKVTEDRNKSSLQTHLRTDVMKVQSQAYVPVETAVVLPRGEPATRPAKAAGTCLAKALPQERLATCSTTASSQGQLLAELTATLPQAHLGPCPSKALSQARPSAKLTKTPSFAHLGTCLTKAQSQAHLATGAVKVQSQAHLPTGLTKVHSQAQLVTEAAKCLYGTHQPAELSSKTRSQPLLAGFRASSQPCHHVGALGTLPRAKPEDRLTRIQPHSHAQGKATQGPCQGSSETQSMLMPLSASARHPTCNIESWGDSGATRAQPSMAGPATPCQEELAASQLASLCAELAAELGSQEDLRALLAKALSQGQVRAALNQALTKKVLGATMTKALPQGMLGTALMKVLSWGELGIALSCTLTPTELRAKLAKAKQGKLAGVLSKALTEEEWAALSQALCQGELGAVLSQSLSQAALRTGVVLPKATSQTAGSRMTMMPTPVEVGSPSAAWGPTLGLVRPQPSKVRVPQDGAWEGFFTGRPAGFLAEMGDGAMLGGSPCSSVVSMGASLTSRVITTVHQYLLIAALDPTPSRERGPSRDSSSNLYLNPEVSEETVCLPPAAGELASDLNPVESDTGPDLPRPPLLQLPPRLWQPLIVNGVGPSTSQPSVAGGTAQSSHKPHVSRVAPHPWASSREGRVAPAMPPRTVGGGKASHSHRCVAAYGGSVCWCRPSGVNKVPPGVYRSSATKVPRQPSVVREDAVQKTQSSNHKRASPDPRERIGKATSGPRRAATVSKAPLAQPQTPEACDISLGLLPGSAAPGHRWALKTQVDPSVFQASPGSRLAHPLPGTAIPRQERKRTEGTTSRGHCPREQVTGRILNELVAGLPQGLDNDLSGSLSPDSTDCGPNVSNSQSSLPSCSSLSLSTMSVTSLTAIDLAEEESLEASLDRDIRVDALLSGEAEGGPQGPGDREETREVSWPHTTPNLHHPPSAGSEPMPILHHSSVSGHVTLSVHWGSDDPDERDVSSGQSSMDLKKSLSRKSYRTGLTRSVSLGNVAPTVYQQPSGASRLTSSLSLPSVADNMAPNPQQPFKVSRVTPSLSESSMTTKVTPSLAQPSVTGGVAPNMDQASVASRVTPNLAQPSVTGGVAPNIDQASVTGKVAPSLAQPSGTSGVAPNLAQASVTSSVAPSLAQPSVTGGVAPSLSEASVTSGVAPSLAQPSVTGGTASNLAQASVTSNVAPSLAQPSITSGVALNLAQPSVTGAVAPELAQPSVIGRVAPILAQLSVTSGTAPNLAQASVISVVAPSLAQSSVTSVVAPNLAWPSLTSVVAPNLAQASMTGGVAPSLAQPSVTGGVAPSLAQPPVTSGVAPNLTQPSVTGAMAPNLAQPSMTGRVVPRLAQPSVTSGVAPNLAQASVISGVAPSLAQPSVTSGVSPNLAQPSMTSAVAPNISWSSVTSMVAPNLAQASLTSGVAPSLARPSTTSGVAPSLAQPPVTSVVTPSLAQPSVTGRVASNLAQPSMTSVMAPSLAQPSVTSGVAPNLAQASVISGVAPSLAQPSVTSGVSPNLAQPSMTSAVAPNISWSSVTSMVAPNLAQASLTSGVAPSLARPSMTSGVAPSLAQPPVTSVVTPSLAQPSVTGRVASNLAQPSMTSVMAPSLAQPSVTSGVAPNLAQPPVTSVVTSSLAQPSVTRGMAPNLMQASVTSRVVPSLTQLPVTGGMAPSLAWPSVTSGMAPNLMQASVTGRMAPSLTLLPMTGGVAPSLAQPPVTSVVTSSLTQPSVTGRVAPNLAQPSMTSVMAPSLAQPSVTSVVTSSLAQPSVTGRVAPNLAQPSMTSVMVPSLAQPSVTSGVALNLAQPPVTSVVTSSLAQPSVTSGMAPNLMQASVTSRVVPSLTPLPMTGGVAPSLAQPSVTSGVAPSLAQAPVATREPLSLFQPSVMSGTSCAVGQSSRPPKVGSNLPSSRVNAVAPSRRHPSVVTEVPPSASYPSGTSSMGQGLSQPSVTPGVDPCQDPVMVSGVASHPQAPEFSEVSLECHQPFSVRGRCPSRTAHSAVAVSAPNLYQVPVASGEDSCLDQGAGISPGALFRGMATSMSPGAMAAGMFPNMSRGTLAAGMFLSVCPGPVCPGIAGSVCQRSAVTGVGPDQFQVASGTPTASPGSVAGVPLVREQASEAGPGFSRASVPNRQGRSPFKFSQASVAPNISPVNVDLPTPLNHQHSSVSTIVAPGYQQANTVSQEPVMGTDNGLVPGAVANRMATAMAPGAVASGVAPSLPPGSVIRGVGQSLPPGPVISDVLPHLPPGYVVSGVAQTLPPGSVIYGISHSLPPGSVIRGMGQGLPPDPMASAVAQSFPLGSVASGMTRTLCPGSVAPSLIAASGAGGMRQSLPVRCAVSFTAPSLVPGSVASEVAPNVSPESVASIMVPASMAGGLNGGLVLGSRASAAGLPSTVGNVAQSLPQGSMLIRITPRPYYGSLAGEGSIAPFQASRAIGLAQLHPRAGEASGTTWRVHQRPTVLQRASQLSHALGMMPFETTDDQVMMKPEDLEKALSQASESSGESIVLEETPWMPHSLPSTDINHSLQVLPNGQKPLLEEVVPSETKSLTSGMAPVPPQALSIAKHWRAGGVTAALQQGSATTWGAPSSHFVTTSRVPSVYMESVRATGAPLAHQRATAAHGSQSPSVDLIVPQNPFVDHVPQSHAHEAGASTIVTGSPKLAHGSTITSSLHPGSVAGMGTPKTSQRSGAARVASHVPLYPPRVSGVASGGFQTEAVPRTHEKPASGDPAQTSRKFLGSRKSYRSVPGSLVSEMLDDKVARIVPSRDVREQAHRSSRQSPEHLPATPPAITPITRTEATHDMGIPGLHPEFRRVSLGYESSPGGSRRPLLIQEPTWGSRDFQSAVAPTDSPRALLTPAVLQGPADAVRAGGQARNSAVPSGAVGPVDGAVTPGGPWEPARASVPGDTVGREAAVNPRQPGKLMASMQVVEKIIIRAVVIIQARTRGYLARRAIKAWHQWAVIIQAAWRGYRVRRDLARLSRAATVIQAVWRGFCIRRGQTPPALLQGVWAEMGGRTGWTSDHRCFQSCQPHVCPLCQSLSPRAGSPPSVVMLVGSSPRTCHMCGHTLPTRVVHGMGRGARVQAGVPWGSGTQTIPGSPRQSRRQSEAAATIQSAWRGFSARRQLRQKQVAAKTLQATWRGHHTRATLTTDALLGPAAWDDPQYMQWPGV
ncbi:IQ domain-containing protein N isoform X2 [Felis catus]|nr:IQ domain-containing protein N isoform X2 [Felis catus]